MNRAAEVELLTHLGRIHAAGATRGGADEAMCRVDEAAAALIGHRLFTIMVVHHRTMEVERVYSNRPDVYPVGGRKTKRDTWWGRQVVEQGQPFIGHGPADLERAFNDHRLIRDLGLGCVLNQPVCYDGQCLGTMNLLDAGEHDVYRKAHLMISRVLGATLLPAMLAA